MPLAAAIALAGWLNFRANHQATYLGLPPVPCLDPALPTVQDFTLTLTISVAGQDRPLDPNIGHDYGHCLRVLHTDDRSGTVHVQANDSTAYTLGDFFNTWHWPLTAHQLLGHSLMPNESLRITVDGQAVDTYEKTPLRAGQTIRITEN